MAKVTFLLVSVILLTRGVSASVHAGIHPPEAGKQTPPWEQTPSPGSRHNCPRSRHPQEQTHPPGSRHPLRVANSRVRSMSGRYASYWNVFLFSFSIHKSKNRKPSIVVYFLLSVWIECAFQMLGRVDCLSQEWDPLVGPYTEACVHHKPNTSILSTRAMKQTHFCFSTKQQRRGISME